MLKRRLAAWFFALALPASGEELLRQRTDGRLDVDQELLRGNPDRLVLALPDGASITATRTGSELRPAGIYWRGHVAGAPLPHAVSLTLERGALVGTVATRERVYTIEPLAGGGHALRERTRGDGSCAGTVSLPGARERARRAATAPAAATPRRAERATAVLDVLLVYSQGFVDAVGTEDFARTRLQGAVDYTTTAFANSGVDARARLVYLIKLAPLSATQGLSPQLTALRVDAQVAALRATYRADLVSAIVESRLALRNECGLAYVLGRGETASDMSPYAFSTVNARCDLGEVLAHELGHNLGLNHEPGNSALEPHEAFASYAYAFALGGQFGTIMSYEANTAPLYSNVHTTYEGVVPGIADQQENARALHDSTPMGANYSNFIATGPARPAAPGALSATLAAATRVRLAWSDNASNETSYHVEVKAGAGSFTEAAQAAANATSHELTLSAGATYSFRVRAQNASGYSGYSNTATLALPATHAVVPADFTARALSGTQVELRWSGVSDGALVEVEVSGPQHGYAVAGGAPGGAGALVVSALEAETPYTFRARSADGATFSDYSSEASTTTGGASGPCRSDARHLCLLAGRFELAVAWKNPHPPFSHGTATAAPVPGSEKTGQFWFFRAENTELVAKMLDGRALNGAFWHYYGALSDVEYWISIRDTQTGDTRTYHNPPFEQCGSSDTRAFVAPPAATANGVRRGAPFPVPQAPQRAAPTRGKAGCAPSDTTLCLRDGRFKVEVAWKNQHQGGASGVGQVVAPLTTTDTGFFWFFNEANQELAVKLLDGRAINGEFWFYWGALSDVEYTITVTDTDTGAAATYHNPPGSICGGQDVDVF